MALYFNFYIWTFRGILALGLIQLALNYSSVKAQEVIQDLQITRSNTCKPSQTTTRIKDCEVCVCLPSGKEEVCKVCKKVECECTLTQDLLQSFPKCCPTCTCT